MRRRVEILLMAVLSLLLAGCNKAPIDAEKMEDILFDIYRMDACISVADMSMQQERRVKYYDSIFEKHGVTKEQFDEALDWYAHNTKDWMLIHENLVTRAEEYVKRVENYEFTPQTVPVVRDSIDTFDLWMPKTKWEWRKGDGEIDRRQTDYTLDDRKYFIGAVSLGFKMNMRCWSDSAGDSVTTMMVLKYSKGANDTLRYRAPVDSADKIYRFTKVIPSGRSVSMVRVQIMDTVENLAGVNVYGVSLEYAYHKDKQSIGMVKKIELNEMRQELRGGEKLPQSAPLLRTGRALQVSHKQR